MSRQPEEKGTNERDDDKESRPATRGAASLVTPTPPPKKLKRKGLVIKHPRGVKPWWWTDGPRATLVASRAHSLALKGESTIKAEDG